MKTRISPEASNTYSCLITPIDRQPPLRQQEEENMLRVLEACDWRISAPQGAAGRLGLKPSTLAYRMKVFGIRKPRKEV